MSTDLSKNPKVWKIRPVEVAPFYADKRTDGHDTCRNCLRAGLNSLRQSDMYSIQTYMWSLPYGSRTVSRHQSWTPTWTGFGWSQADNLQFVDLSYCVVLCVTASSRCGKYCLSLWVGYWPSEERIFVDLHFVTGMGLCVVHRQNSQFASMEYSFVAGVLGYEFRALIRGRGYRCLASWYERRQGWLARRSDQT